MYGNAIHSKKRFIRSFDLPIAEPLSVKQTPDVLYSYLEEAVKQSVFCKKTISSHYAR
jgi:hypothetical protein